MGTHGNRDSSSQSFYRANEVWQISDISFHFFLTKQLHSNKRLEAALLGKTD